MQERYVGKPEGLAGFAAWSATGEMAINDRERKFTFAANFSKNPGTYTIQFNVERPDGITFGLFHPRATVVWSVEGNAVQRTFQVTDGVSISGQGQGVRVTVEDLSQGFGPTIPYNVSALLTQGQRANTEVPPSLFPVLSNSSAIMNPGIAAAGGFHAFEVPHDCGVNSAFVSVAAEDAADGPIENDEIRVEFRTNDGTGLGLRMLTVPYDGLNQWLPVPGGTNYIVVYNNRPAGVVNAGVIYGIDG